MFKLFVKNYNKLKILTNNKILLLIIRFSILKNNLLNQKLNLIIQKNLKKYFKCKK